MKKSFSLLITIVLITIFSFLAIFIVEVKSISNFNNEIFYLQTQSRLHFNFFKNYLQNYDFKENCPKKINFAESIYNLEAKIECKDEIVNIDVYLKTNSKFETISLYEKLTINL